MRHGDPLHLLYGPRLHGCVYSVEGASAGYDLAIKVGFVILLCGHALIVYSRAVT